MEIKQLEAFLAVMTAGSITAAGRLLDRSQSQVTRLIQELEAELGFALFERNGPRIKPTSEAIEFHSDAERFLTGIGRLSERARMIAAREPATIEIAAIPAFAVGFAPAVLAALPGDLLPRNVHLRSMAAEAAVSSVLSGAADLCIASLPVDHPGLQVHGIFQAPCVAAVSSADLLARKDVISLHDLEDRCLITMANPYRLRRRIDQALAAEGVRPSRIIDTNAAMNAFKVASTGLGIAIIEPATAYGCEIVGAKVHPLDTDIPFLWGVFTAASRPVSSTILRFIELAEQQFAAHIPGFRKHDPRRMDLLADATFGNNREIPQEP